MTSELTWRVGAPAQPPAGTLELLTAAFAAPPYAYSPERVAGRLAAWDRLLGERDFRLVEARRGSDLGPLVGVAWGWPTGDLVGGVYAGLYRRMRESLGPAMLALRGTEVVEVAVDPAAQGQGIGQGLLDRLTGGGPGWLLARAESPASGWYRRHGWDPVGTVDIGVLLEVLVRP
ncbi:MAG: GNAT family N-acetyltransferase [Lapillicoccus sp.]